MVLLVLFNLALARCGAIMRTELYMFHVLVITFKSRAKGVCTVEDP